MNLKNLRSQLKNLPRNESKTIAVSKERIFKPSKDKLWQFESIPGTADGSTNMSKIQNNVSCTDLGSKAMVNNFETESSHSDNAYTLFNQIQSCRVNMPPYKHAGTMNWFK
jgi:hypothetical protein